MNSYLSKLPLRNAKGCRLRVRGDGAARCKMRGPDPELGEAFRALRSDLSEGGCLKDDSVGGGGFWV